MESVKNEISILKAFNAKYPWETKVVRGGNFTYRHCKEHSKQPITLVLLTGGLGVSDAFYRHFEAFSAKYNVLTFDYSYDYVTNVELAHAIAELLKGLHIEKAYFIGQSYGGFLAQIMVKYHPEVVKGLILSNTGSLALDMKQEDIISLTMMVQRMKKMSCLLKFVPIGLIKPMIKKKIFLACKEGTPKEQAHIKALMSEVLKKIDKKHELHMCQLMSDLINERTLTPEDTKAFTTRVFLLLSKDDDTFTEGTKKSLMSLFKASKLKTDLEGGHLALLMRVDSYIQEVVNFIEEQENKRLS